MKKAHVSIALLSLAVSNCAYQNPYASNMERDATTGALLGGAVGSMIGQSTNDSLVGAAIGAGIGGLIGNSIGYDKDRRQSQYQQPYGNGGAYYGSGNAGYNTNCGPYAGVNYGYSGY